MYNNLDVHLDLFIVDQANTKISQITQQKRHAETEKEEAKRDYENLMKSKDAMVEKATKANQEVYIYFHVMLQLPIIDTSRPFKPNFDIFSLIFLETRKRICKTNGRCKYNEIRN